MTTSKVLQKITATLVPLLAILILGAPAAFAEALKPWLHLTSGARPTYLHPGVAQDAVQKLTVSATSGSYVVEYKGKEHTLSVGASSREVRESLEKLYGANNLEVSSEPGPYNAHEVYEIKFVDALADRAVPLLVKPLKTGEVTGGPVEAREVVKGQPDGEIVAFAENLGDAPVEGLHAPLRITDTLPAHVKAVGVVASAPEEENTVRPLPCSLESSSRVSCQLEGTYKNESGQIVPETLSPFEEIEVRIAVEVEPDAVSGEENEVVASGGEVPEALLRRPLTISSGPTPGGVEEYELVNEAAGGSADTQAGSHPFGPVDK
jgi:hypothetical protein